MLAAERHGSGPRVVLAHGFTQTRRSWGPVADDLATDHEVVLVDLPGHGRSAHVTGDLWEAGRLLGRTGGDAAYVGYSLGGRVALHLALAGPERVRALVLVGASPGITDEGERTARRRADDRAAARLRREGVPTFVRRWLRQPLFATLPAEAAGFDLRLENTAAGLALALELLGAGVQEPLWDRLPELAMPVLVVAGERDEKYVATAQATAGAIGANADVALVPDAGHAAHLERPDAFLAVVRPFLAAHTVAP